MWTPPEKHRHPVAPTRWPTAAEAAASRWFSPVSCGPLQLEQRTWVPAMVPWRASEDGQVTQDVVDWYARFAGGRPGALVVEATGIRDVPSGPLLRIGDDRFVPGLARLAAAVRAASGGHTRLLIQLIDFLVVRRRPPADRFFARFLAVDPGHRARMTALTGEPRWADAPESELRAALLALGPGSWGHVLTTREQRDLDYGQREQVTDLDVPHIAALPAVLPGLFADASARAEAAGFDGVELHYAHAYTMASFLSRTNTRADGYGGAREGRVRLPLEVISAVRERVGEGFAVGCRMLGDEVIAGGSDLGDAVWFARAFARAGLDFISVSKGGKFDDAEAPKVGEAVYPYTGPSGYECMPTVISDERGPFARNVQLSSQIRAAIRGDGWQTPVITAGGFNDFKQAEAALAAGHADIVAAARQSLADPDWFLKVALGRGEEVRRCKFTNYCEALDTRHKQVTCQLWDRTQLTEPDVTLSHDGKRRLLAPRWRP